MIPKFISIGALQDLLANGHQAEAALILLLRELSEVKAQLKLLVATHYPRPLLDDLMQGRTDTLEKYAAAVHRRKKSWQAEEATSFHLKPDNRLAFGRGWYPVESDGNGYAWRWSGPERESFIALPVLRPGRYAVVLSVSMLDNEAPLPATIGLLSDRSEPIEWQPEPGGGYLIGRASIEISAAAQAAGCLLRLFVAETVAPAEIGKGSDRRVFGLCLMSIQVTRVEEAADAAVADAA